MRYFIEPSQLSVAGVEHTGPVEYDMDVVWKAVPATRESFEGIPLPRLSRRPRTDFTELSDIVM